MRRFLPMLALVPFLVAAQTPQAPSGPPDLAAEETAIKNADIELDRACQAKDKAAFAALLADDVVVFPADKPVVGKQGFLDAWARFFEPGDGPTLTWRPTNAKVFASGDLGYTDGKWEAGGKDKEGKPRAARGYYHTLWRKMADGKWRAIVDLGTGPVEEGVRE